MHITNRLRLLVLLNAVCLLSLTCSIPSFADGSKQEYDVVIYGGTSSAVTAAVQVKRMGKTVAIVCPDKHLGGLSSGGLGWTDSGKTYVIGGLAREFYQRIWREYQDPAAWKWQSKEEYGNRGQRTPAMDSESSTMWIFEPHVAEKVFEDLIAEHDIPVFRDRWLDRQSGVVKQDGRIVSISMLNGETYQAKMFLDTTYEGDLMAATGVSYHVGREANDVYNEEWNGVQVGILHHSHHFQNPVDPYVVPGDPSSGLIPYVSGEDPGNRGEGDHRVQAYCFRMCLSRHPENRVPFPKPEGYDADRYELLARIYSAGREGVFGKHDPIPNLKTDTNNQGPFSTDNVGANYDYPEASYERRQEIIKDHEDYQKGIMYFLANDPRVPKKFQDRVRLWGLAKDEFVDNENWPHQLYIREARRMIGEYVVTEHDCLSKRTTDEPVGMGSYTMDSHNVQRYVKPDGTVQNEGDIGVKLKKPYLVAYGALTPKREECTNLLVPVCLSSSHIAFGSIRMEPVFMILGQSAATAAAMAIDRDIDIQELPYNELSERLVQDKQILVEPAGHADE